MKLEAINQLLEVSSTDAEDARRRKLLNILLLGVTALTFLTLVAVIIVGIGGQEDLSRLRSGTIALIIGFVVIFLINRYWSGDLAGSFFLLIFIISFSVVDEPRQVVEGRALFLFTIPILMASVILRPWASFFAAGVCSFTITFIAMTNLEDYAQGAPPVPTILGFFAVALVSWLSARSLENALADLRILNVELEQRVEERTRDLAEANLELAKANERLKELDRLKSRFVSIVSHELRTPLNAIQGFAEMLEAGIYGDIEEEQHKPLARIIANVQRLLGIVNDLLDQARIEAGELALHIAPLTLSDLGADLHSTMDVLAESKDLVLSTEIDPTLPEKVCGDRQRLHQIMVNLVNNAFKFTEEGGIYIRMYQTDINHWAIDVMDTGPGIPKEAQQYIFEPFRQVDGSTTRKYKGAGLGLSIVQQLTQLMGGEIRLESEVGHGSTFTVVLPLVTPGEEEICPSSLH